MRAPFLGPGLRRSKAQPTLLGRPWTLHKRGGCQWKNSSDSDWGSIRSSNHWARGIWPPSSGPYNPHCGSTPRGQRLASACHALPWPGRAASDHRGRDGHRLCQRRRRGPHPGGIGASGVGAAATQLNPGTTDQHAHLHSDAATAARAVARWLQPKAAGQGRRAWTRRPRTSLTAPWRRSSAPRRGRQ